jgi:hypothetical protein
MRGYLLLRMWKRVLVPISRQSRESRRLEDPQEGPSRSGIHGPDVFGESHKLGYVVPLDLEGVLKKNWR